jgi:hypothetical protein
MSNLQFRQYFDRYFKKLLFGVWRQMQASKSVCNGFDSLVMSLHAANILAPLILKFIKVIDSRALDGRVDIHG